MRVYQPNTPCVARLKFRCCSSLARLCTYVSQTNDLAQHPVDISLKWAKCVGFLCDSEPAILQPAITCEGEMEFPVPKTFIFDQHWHCRGRQFLELAASSSHPTCLVAGEDRQLQSCRSLAL